MAIMGMNQDFLDAFRITGFFAPEKKGGQKTVYFVEREGSRQVLKLFDGGKDARFDREMEIYEKFKHLEGIPKIYETVDYKGEIVCFEQYIEGNTLIDILAKYSGDYLLIADLLLNLFETLQPIWESKLVHRDLKPENIIIKPDGKAVIIDFGIARDLAADTLTVTGFQPGSWRWQAPEQYQGLKDMISYKTDFFSLGVIGYFLYYQKFPFGNSPDEINAKYKSGDESFLVEDTCPLKDYFIESMRFRASHRPKD
ncbi:MAG: protein kinase, partial [Taibaiella sp.]|nr:protein kinase [Taibaiella sp.]